MGISLKNKRKNRTLIIIKIDRIFLHCLQFRAGIQYTTFTCEPIFLLPYLYKRIRNAGGKIYRKRIVSFDELHTFDLVINCTGLGAKELVKDDIHLKPIRGQGIRKRNQLEMCCSFYC